VIYSNQLGFAGQKKKKNSNQLGLLVNGEIFEEAYNMNNGVWFLICMENLRK